MKNETRTDRKGALTRQAILDVALKLVASRGFDGITISRIAQGMRMSKSGVFAHFGSREELQVAVIQAYYQSFEKEVFLPSLAAPRGLPRLEMMVERWLEFRIKGEERDCMFISGAVEFDDRPGPVKDVLVESVRSWRAALLKAIRLAVECGHLQASTDQELLLFQIYSLVLGMHHDLRFLNAKLAETHAKQSLRLVWSFYQVSV